MKESTLLISQWLGANDILLGTIGVTVDGAGNVITVGSKGFRVVERNVEVLGWTILAGNVGSCVMDIRKCSYASFPTTVSIAGTEKPTLVNARKNQDMDLTTWTILISAGDIIEFYMESAADIKQVSVYLKVRVE